MSTKRNDPTRPPKDHQVRAVPSGPCPYEGVPEFEGGRLTTKNFDPKCEFCGYMANPSTERFMIKATWGGVPVVAHRWKCPMCITLNWAFTPS
jgi:hypothetical protein